MTDRQRPGIVSTDAEREILYGQVWYATARALGPWVPGTIPADDADAVAGDAVTAVLRSLRVLSARQLAVLLAEEANRHEERVIHEPPRYTAQELAGE